VRDQVCERGGEQQPPRAKDAEAEQSDRQERGQPERGARLAGGELGSQAAWAGERLLRGQHDQPAGERRGGDERQEGGDGQGGNSRHFCDEKKREAGDAEGAQARVTQNFETALARGRGQQAVAAIGQAVQVQAAGQRRPERHGERGSERRREDLYQPPVRAGEEATQAEANEREPARGPTQSVGVRRVGLNRDSGEEADRQQQAVHAAMITGIKFCIRLGIRG